uniref:UBC core domain-containing protein n=1 Tax=Arundo donax TaxID=35708 RepID=A0A0A9ANE4_ARUDO
MKLVPSGSEYYEPAALIVSFFYSTIFCMSKFESGYGAAGTPYENGVFRMKLLLSHDFPQSPPKGSYLLSLPKFFIIHSVLEVKPSAKNL